jgi:acetylornithine deacetylase/succinyl-diaminopimelate desuccinylase family protein
LTCRQAETVREGEMVVQQAREAALAQIDEERLIQLARDLVRFDTDNPPGNETALAEFLGSYLGKLGLEIEYQEVKPGRSNVLARLGSADASPHLILNGHIDTVPSGAGWTKDPHGGEVIDGRMYGRGTSDMKAGVAAMMIAVEAIVRAGIPLRGRLTLAGVIDEEDTQDGTRYAVEQGLRGDFAIVGEPTEFLPVIAHKGDMYIEITTHGVEAHASTPHAGVNAIDQMADVIVELRALAADYAARPHPIVGPPTLTVGTIEGGVITCMVPGSCSITVDRRVLPGEDPEAIIGEVRDRIGRIKARRSDFQAEARIGLFGPPMETAADNPVVGAIREATAEVLGKDPGVHGWSATCDANILVDQGSTPSVVFGPGSIASQAHRPDESIGVDEIVAAAKIFTLAILKLLA